MIRLRLAALISMTMLAAACSTGASTAPSAVPSASAGSAAGQGMSVPVTLTDSLRIEPAEINVSVGEVTFVVTNTGAIEHEFFVGDEAAQAEHESEMTTMPGMGTETNGISVKPGETKELTMVFDSAGTTLAGCHVAGHYGGGMKAVVTIAP